MSDSPVSTVKSQIVSLFENAAKRQLTTLERLGLTVQSNQLAQVMRDVTGVGMNYVLDTSKDIRARLEVLDSIISWEYSFFAAKSNDTTRGMLHEWHLLVGRHWYGGALMLLNDRIAMGPAVNPWYPSLQVVKKIVTKFAEKQIIPYGRLVVAVAFDERLYTAEFVALIQSMMMGAGGSNAPAERETSLNLNEVAAEARKLRESG